MKSEYLVEYIGYLAILTVTVKIGIFVASLVNRRFLQPRLNVTKCGGKWALVTGSTDGIGKAYAVSLAKKGMNVVLVSRSPYKLQNVAAEIEQKFTGVKTKIIDVDFVKEDCSSYIKKIEDGIKDLDIGILVNNVGMSYEYPQEFLELDSTYVDSMINVNIIGLNAMTRIILPQMVERKAGAVINISSFLASFPTPLLTVYASSKAYVDLFTQGLAKEYEAKGITFQCIMPGYVVSNMSKIRRSSWNIPTPEEFVKSALSRLGIDCRTTGFWAHDVMNFCLELLPTSVLVKIMYGQNATIKAKALKKKQKQN